MNTQPSAVESETWTRNLLLTFWQPIVALLLLLLCSNGMSIERMTVLI